MSVPDSEQELRRLEAELRAVTKTRMDLERGLANPDALRAAASRAHRDRDAVTSPLLEEARQGIVEAIGSFHETWRHVDKCVRQMERFADVIGEAPPRVQECRDEVMAVAPQVREARARIGARVSAAGLIGVVPGDEVVDGQG
ncbi:hypothetical protein [Mycobacterium sp. SMC-13]|uniref:hypothetical protein n=1 Tax=Mycobacterium sp. SMC-13 TaxID=3381626 RepID=UPI00387611BE